MNRSTVRAAIVSIMMALGIHQAGEAQSNGSLRTSSRSQFKTPWGHPDLQGTWANQTITPLERPAQFAGKEFLTEAEAAELERQTRDNGDADVRTAPGTEADVARAYNEAWWDRATKVVSTLRSSLIIDPKDGKIPPLTPEAREREKLEPTRPAVRHMTTGGRGTDSWLDRGNLSLRPGRRKNEDKGQHHPLHLVHREVLRLR